MPNREKSQRNGEIHRSQLYVGVRDNRERCGFIFQACGERAIGGILANFVANDKSLCLGRGFGIRTEDGGVFNNKVGGGIYGYFNVFRKRDAFAVVFDGEFNSPRVAGFNKSLRQTEKRQAKENSRSKNEIFNNKFLAKNSAAEEFIFGSTRRASGAGAERIISWCQKILQRIERYAASYVCGSIWRLGIERTGRLLALSAS